MSLRSEVIRIMNELLGNSKKISELTSLPSNIQNSDLIEVVRSGENYKALGSQLPSGGGGGVVETIVAGTNITVDSTDPANPIVSASGGGGSQDLDSVLTEGSTASITTELNVTVDVDGITTTIVANGDGIVTSVTDGVDQMGIEHAYNSIGIGNGSNGINISVAGVTTQTPSGGDNSTKIATTAFVETRVLAAIAGLKWKNSVRVATTVAGTLATSFENGDTVDGVVLATGNRILIKNQASATENGIYTVNASGAPTRATDADSAAELEGASVTVQEGTSNANTTWTQTTDGITIGSSNIVWAQFGSSVPDADATTKGIARLYPSTSLGTNTDGAPTQNGVKTYVDTAIAGVTTVDSAIIKIYAYNNFT